VREREKKRKRER
jgi:hypothetical protein